MAAPGRPGSSHPFAHGHCRVEASRTATCCEALRRVPDTRAETSVPIAGSELCLRRRRSAVIERRYSTSSIIQVAVIGSGVEPYAHEGSMWPRPTIAAGKGRRDLGTIPRLRWPSPSLSPSPPPSSLALEAEFSRGTRPLKQQRHRRPKLRTRSADSTT